MRIDDLKGYLAGTWTLTRSAVDRRAGTRHEMRGHAVFAHEDDGLLYRETVCWEAAGRTFDGYRVYRFTFPDPAQAVVSFEDGQFFHTLDLTKGVDRIGHDCPPDRYIGTYRVLDAARYQVSWRVKGPRKDLLLLTVYRRMAPREATPRPGSRRAPNPDESIVNVATGSRHART